MNTIVNIEEVDGGYTVRIGKKHIFIHAIDNVSLNINSGEILGIAGESGCGKSTLAKIIYGALFPPLTIKRGRVILNSGNGSIDIIKTFNENIEILKKQVWWKEISYIPQNSMNVLNPLKRIKDQFIETFRFHGINIDEREAMKNVVDYIKSLGLPIDVLNAYPFQLSGGMRQRVVIALSLLFNPKVIIADEPTTAVDVVTQLGILNLLKEWQSSHKSSLVLISHDMSVHAYMDDRIAIMYAGRVVELGEAENVFNEPLHPYTKGLISSLIRRGERGLKYGIPGSPPDLINPPPGCRFHPRCPFAMDICRREEPPTILVSRDRYVSCWLYTKR